MRIYRPKSVVGGHLGRTYSRVVTAAKRFANSAPGRALKTGAKKAILQAGSDVLNNFLSGQSGIESLKGTAKKLKRQLTKNARKRFKKSVLGKRKKLGGLLLYRIKQRRRHAKQAKGQLLYKIPKRKKSKRRGVKSRKTHGSKIRRSQRLKKRRRKNYNKKTKKKTTTKKKKKKRKPKGGRRRKRRSVKTTTKKRRKKGSNTIKRRRGRRNAKAKPKRRRKQRTTRKSAKHLRSIFD